MPFICRECGQYYNQDSSVGYECVNCGETGSIERCEDKEEKTQESKTDALTKEDKYGK